MNALHKILSNYYFPPESDSFHAAHFEPKGPSYIPYTPSRIPSLSQPGLNHPAAKPDSNRLRVPTRGDLKAVSEALEREVRYESRYLIAEATDMGYWTCLRDIWDKVGDERGLAQAAATARNERGGSSDRRTDLPRAQSHIPSRQESRTRNDRPPPSYRPSGLTSSSEWDRKAYEEKTNPPPPEKYPRLPRPPVTASIGKVDESKRPSKLTSSEKKDGERKEDKKNDKGKEREKEKEKEKEEGKEKGKKEPKSSVHPSFASKYRIL